MWPRFLFAICIATSIDAQQDPMELLRQVEQAFREMWRDWCGETKDEG